jgi:hypothetical protein
MHEIPSTMQAAVYRGVNDVRLETVPVHDTRDFYTGMLGRLRRK